MERYRPIPQSEVIIPTEDPQNSLFKEALTREQYDFLWQQEKLAQEQWNMSHFTGWKGGRYFMNGQVR